jgi:hypothetical protein
MTNPAKKVLVFKLWKKLCIVVRTFEFMILSAGDCSVNTFVLPENKSVNVLRLIGGMSGDDAIEPGVPPTCGFWVAPGPPTEAIGIFGISRPRFLRLLLFLVFGINLIL